MSGLQTQLSAVLLINSMLVVHGNYFREDKYLQDKDHIERYRRVYLTENTDTDEDSDGENELDFGNWKESDAGYEGYSLNNPNRIDRGGIGLEPDFFEKPGTGNKFWKQSSYPDYCQHIPGIPSPDSGCCGVQLSSFPVQKPSNQYPWQFMNNRFRRDADNDIVPSKMIIGGRPTDLHDLPWLARLRIKPNSNCGATIINSRYIITAAHCVHNTYFDLDQLVVYLSEYNTRKFPNDCIITRRHGKKCIKNIKMGVEKVIIHEHYNDTYLINDIALVKLHKDIKFTDFIRPVCLPTEDIKDLDNEEIVIAGWGLNGHRESYLKQAAVIDYVPNDLCKEYYSYKDASMFCSIGSNGQDVCKGDSGGPLMTFYKNKYFLSGVVNGKRKTEKCGSSVPSLFNNVYYHMDWIRSKIN